MGKGRLGESSVLWAFIQMVRGVDRMGWETRGRDTSKSVMPSGDMDRARMEEERARIIRGGNRAIIDVMIRIRWNKAVNKGDI